MYIIAKTRAGQEFLYKASTAHKVSKASAGRICEILNNRGYRILADGERWQVYQVDEHDSAYDIAAARPATIRNGIVKIRFLSYNDSDI